MANDYTTSTDAFADISEGSYLSSDYPAMANFVTVASRLIDLEVGRWDGFFYPTTDTVVRYYDGSGEDSQEIDEFVSISEVAVAETGGTASTDYTAWASTDYMLYPYNYSLDGKPIYKLFIDGDDKPLFYRYRKSIRITGVAGYAATTPDPIEQACKIQAVRWFMRAKGGYQDETGTDELGKLFYKGQLKLDGDVKALLHPYKLELMR